MQSLSKSGIERIKQDEGLRLSPYICPAGKWTVGYGRNLEDNGLKLPETLELIGQGISLDMAEKMLMNDIAKCQRDLEREYPWSSSLDSVRYAVLVNMTYNLGISGLSGFKKTLDLVKKGRYEEASRAMLVSKWAKQVKSRAHRLAKAMSSGKWE